MAWFGKGGDERDAPEPDAPEPDAAPEDAAPEDAAPDAAPEDAAPDAPEPDAPEPDAPEPDAPEPATLGPAVSTTVVFLPEPEGEDHGAAPAAAVAPALEWTVKARLEPPKAAARTALQEKMAEIAKKHKDGPLEDMLTPIREALAAAGREVPDDWTLAIADGLRRHGPITLNLDGPGPAPR